MEHTLTKEELDTIIESLGYKKDRIQNYQEHPSYEFKQSELKKVEDLTDKIRAIKKSM